MFEFCSIKESVDYKRNNKKLCKCNPSSKTKKFKSFVKDFITYQDDENHRKDNKSVGEELSIEKIESENSIKSKNEKHKEKIEEYQK